MKPPIITIEYQVGEKKQTRRLDREWECPVCAGTLDMGEQHHLKQAQRIRCLQCGESFRLVGIEIPQFKSRSLSAPRVNTRPPSDGRRKRTSRS